MTESYTMMNKTEADLINNIIASHTFLDYGIVESVGDGTVDVKLITKRFGEELLLKGVELLNVGSSAISVDIAAVQGDLVLLLGLRTYIEKLSIITAPLDKVSRLYYDLANVKAVQIAPKKTSKVTVTIKKDGEVTVVSAGAISLESEGLSLNAGTGLASLGNGLKTLADWLHSLIDDLNGLVTVGSATTQTISPATIAILTARAAELDTFLE